MRVIIPGGSGLIGSALASQLATAGHEVIVLSRRPNELVSLPPGVRAERWDALTGRDWCGLIDETTAVVNLAGENLSAARWTKEQKRRIIQSRINAGQAVVEAVQAAAQKPQVVIQASGVGYYGPTGDEELTESAPRGSDFGADVTQYWEASTEPVEAMGVRRVVVRSGLVLSRDGGALPRMLLPFRLFAGGPIGTGKQWWSWIHIADEVRALIFLLENEAARGTFNLCAPQPLRNRDFARVLGSVMGRPSLLPVPEFVLRVLFGEMADVLVRGQRVVPERLLALGFEFKFSDVESALRNLLA